MSIYRGLQIPDIPNTEDYFPKIKWINGRRGDDGFFVVRVLDMYLKDGSTMDVRIPADAVWRMINADRGTKYGFWFDPEEEKGDLDDDSYLGFSYIQARYHVSVSVMLEVQRLWKRAGRNGWSWLYLKKKNKHGGRPNGGGRGKKFNNLPLDEQERIASVFADYDKIAENCYAKDWVTEYIELEKDIAIYKGEKYIGKKATIQKFTAERKKWLESHTIEDIRKHTKTL